MAQTQPGGPGSGLSGVLNVYASLPHPKAAVTVPIIVIFAVLVFIAIARKIIVLAVIAAVICVGFLAYQSGAFNHWVDKGKNAVDHK